MLILAIAGGGHQVGLYNDLKGSRNKVLDFLAENLRSRPRNSKSFIPKIAVKLPGLLNVVPAQKAVSPTTENNPMQLNYSNFFDTKNAPKINPYDKPFNPEDNVYRYINEYLQSSKADAGENPIFTKLRGVAAALALKGADEREVALFKNKYDAEKLNDQDLSKIKDNIFKDQKQQLELKKLSLDLAKARRDLEDKSLDAIEKKDKDFMDKIKHFFPEDQMYLLDLAKSRGRENVLLLLSRPEFLDKTSVGKEIKYKIRNRQHFDNLLLELLNASDQTTNY